MSQTGLDHLSASLRDNNRRLYLASFFLPQRHREAVITVQAFHAEIASLHLRIREPAAGEIRLQWWREVLEGARMGEATANPLARQLLQVLGEHQLPPQPLLAMLDARVFDFYNDPMPTRHEFEGYAGDAWSSMFQLACLIAHPESSTRSAETAGHAGVAWAVAETLRLCAVHRANGRIFLPTDLLNEHGLDASSFLAADAVQKSDALVRQWVDFGRDHLAKALAALVKCDPTVRRIFLPLALLEHEFSTVYKSAGQVLISPQQTASWRQQIRLWRAAGREPYHAT